MSVFNNEDKGKLDKCSSVPSYPHKEITEKIIGAAIEVHSTLGPGLLESVYEEALSHEFTLRNIKFERQKQINLVYKSKPVGIHRIDFLVEDNVIIEIKAVDELHKIFESQLLTYLKAMNKRVGLLVNFNVDRLKDGLKRMII